MQMTNHVKVEGLRINLFVFQEPNLFERAQSERNWLTSKEKESEGGGNVTEKRVQH